MSLAKSRRTPELTISELARTRLRAGVTLYARAHMVGNKLDIGPRWIACEITEAFLDRVLQLRRACGDLSLCEAVAEACPAGWDHIDVDVEVVAWEMRVTTHSIEFNGFPRQGSGHLAATLITFSDLCSALGSANNHGAEPIEGLTNCYAWFGGALFTSTYDLDSFLELAKECFPELEALDTEARLAGHLHNLVPPPTAACTTPARRLNL